MATHGELRLRELTTGTAWGFARLDPSDDKDTYPTWSPDGSKIAYRVSGRVKIMDAAGGAGLDLFDLFPEIGDKSLIFSGYQFAWK